MSCKLPSVPFPSWLHIPQFRRPRLRRFRRFRWFRPSEGLSSKRFRSCTLFIGGGFHQRRDRRVVSTQDVCHLLHSASESMDCLLSLHWELRAAGRHQRRQAWACAQGACRSRSVGQDEGFSRQGAAGRATGTRHRTLRVILGWILDQSKIRTAANSGGCWRIQSWVAPYILFVR